MQGKNKVMFRSIAADLAHVIKRKQSALLMGPRQVGKTTLIENLLPPQSMTIALQDPSERRAYEQDPSLLIRRVRAEKSASMIFIDEAQKVPELMDAVQLLIDRNEASFLITGSSARKLKRHGTNLLPGRVKSFRLDPLSWSELGWKKESRIRELAQPNSPHPSSYTFEDAMVFGSLPGIIKQDDVGDRRDFLTAYAHIYLEEEIRAESLTRKIGAFARFLELAAAESGTAPNLSKLAMESGVSAPAIRGFYALLEETLVMERVDPFLRGARKRILSSSRYFLFDLGVRNCLARLPLTPELLRTQKGTLFEQAVTLELIRRLRSLHRDYRVCFWRTSGGAEVDLVIDTGTTVIPIEIKAGTTVCLGELKGLRHFLEDYKAIAPRGYVITQGTHPEQLSKQILALPWSAL